MPGLSRLASACRAAVRLLVAGLAGALLWTAPLAAQTSAAARASYPARPITLIVPLPSGGVSQRLADILAPALAQTLGVPVEVKSMPGESGALGARYVAGAAPDGYTLLIAPSTLLLLDANILPSVGFSPQKDLDPLVMAVRSPTVLVIHHSVPATSVTEFVAYLKQHPDVAFGASGRGSINDLIAGEFFRQTGTRGHMAYFEGGGAVMPALVSGQVLASFQDAALVVNAASTGAVRTLALTGTESSPLLPNVPTFNALGIPQMDAYTWQAIAAPAGLPANVRHVLENALRAALLNPVATTRLQSNGWEVVAASSRQLQRVITDERRRWRDLMQADGPADQIR